jgi:protein-disulfide isomerase
MRIRSGITPLALLVVLYACGGNPTDIEELKKGQKEILERLATLDKTVQQIKTAPPATPQRPQIDPNKVYNIPVGIAPAKGGETAKVTVVEFADYQCPFCGQAEGLVKQVLEAYPKEVKLVYKQFPLTTIHPQALSAAKAAVAAGRQGKYWEMHDLLFENQRQLAPEKYTEFAEQLALDVPQFQKDMESPEVLAQINRDMQDGKAADVTGTPTLFVNGKRLMNRSFDGFRQMIDASLGRAPAPPPPTG